MAYDYSYPTYDMYGIAPEMYPQVTSPSAIPPMGTTSAVPASAVGMAAPAYGSDLYSPYGDIANIFASAGYLPENPSSSPLSAYDGQQGYQFVTNRNKMAGTKANPTGYVTADPNAQYRFVNLRGDDNVMYEGAGEEGLRNVYDLARQQSTDLGKKAYWSAERYDPATESWVSVADDPRGGLKGAINKYGDVVLPALGALAMAIPGFQPLGALGLTAGSAGGIAAGSALGSIASSAAQGRGLGSTLGRALLSGATAYGGAQLAPAISGALSAPTSAATNTATSEVAKAAISEGAKQALGQVAPQIIGDTMILTGAREAAKAALPAVVGGVLGGAGSGALSKLPAIGSKEPNPDTLVVTGPRPLTPFEQAFSDLLPTVAPTPASSQTTANPEDTLVVTGERLPTASTEAATGALTTALTPTQTSTTANPDDPIVVTGERADPVVDKLAAAGIPATVAGGAAVNALTSTQAPTEQAATEKPAGTPSTLEEISTWLDRAGLVSSILGPLAEAIAGGGKGGGGNRNINAAGLGGLNPVFGAQLPAANMPAMQPRTMPQQDWNRYAFGPEQSFFTNVPQRLAKGGLAHSDGRSDDVPAMLSRGEYVIDAETMALLGNGDPFAGADKMDEWRVNVRKHKGRQLMKGGISPDAKMPNQYMGGGRV